MRRRRPGAGRRHGGFTLLELAVTIAIIAVLAGMLLKRVTFYSEQAEIAAMETVLGSLRSGLHMKAGQMIVQGKAGELPTLVSKNPMELLAEQPSNYLGEYFSPQSFTITPGNWYFDRTKLLLVYIMNSGSDPQTKEPKRLKFKVQVLLAGEVKGPENAMDPAHDTIEGVALNQIVE
jgi:prepilin-type N-terminal cleavage/methylation domain-containing protein